MNLLIAAGGPRNPVSWRRQQNINRLIGDYDICVGVMWRHFGTPTGLAGTGTEKANMKAGFPHGVTYACFFKSHIRRGV